VEKPAEPGWVPVWADAAGCASRRDLGPILRPRSVAIVGASNSAAKFGSFFTRCFLEMGFARLYPVNPHETEILGMKAYPRVSDVPDEVDLAFIVTAAETVLPIVEDCGRKGVKGIVIYSSGFAEKGPEGLLLQQQIVSVARAHGARIIGPNCMGIYSPKQKLSYYPGLPKQSGPIAMVSHSGSLSVYLVEMAKAKGLYFDTVVSCGNEADITSVDLLEYFGEDPEVRVIVAYLEGVKDGRRFLRLAKEVSRRKPIIVLKGGMTDQGGQAAGSHTGAMAGSGRVWKAVFEQTGIIANDSIQEAVDTLVACCDLPLPKGPRLAIVTGPGGPGVLAADACIEQGLELAPLSSATRARLSELVPSVGTSLRNPVDLGMTSNNEPEMYRTAIETLSTDPGVDAILAIGSADRPFAEVMSSVRQSIDKPLLVAGLLPPESYPEGYLYLAAQGVAAYPDAHRAVVALAKLYRYAVTVNERSRESGAA